MYNWSIPTKQLTGPRRRGGRESQRGFAFQDAYTCLHLSRLLDSSHGVVVVRPEGAQDVDLLYSDGREEYVQLKHEPDEHYTLIALRSILQGFALDLLEAGRPTTLTFVLIARSNHIDAAVLRLRDGKPSDKDIINVAELLAGSTKDSPAPRCLIEINKVERNSLAKQLLDQTTFRFGMGDEIAGCLSFESHACTQLAKHGVSGSELQNAFNTLKAALDKYEFARADVEELLKRFVGGAAIELFEGDVEALTDELLSRPAASQRIYQFYAGAPLDWDIIAAHGDIERDQQDALIRQLANPSETLRIACIAAEPGAGKSTLSWRVAAELHRQHGAFVIRIRNKEDVGVWYRMPDFCQKMRRPFYVLVDDVFRDPDVVNALRELNPSLPITVLATSRANEYRPHRLKGEVVRVPLKEPSPEEKERILYRLGKTRTGLALEQQQRLDVANQFLVLMMEITAGKELKEIIRDTLEWLQTHDESAYRAYEYLCFTYKHSISIPVSLLERLDLRGRFHNLPDRETAQGLIFYDDGRTGHVRVGHPVIAETAYIFYESHRAPANLLQEITTAIDSTNYLERRFAAHLLRTLSYAKSPVLHIALPKIEPAIREYQKSATSITELTIWRAFYSVLGQYERANKCIDTALTLIPISSGDCNMLVKLYRERGRERDALPILAEWVCQHPDYHGAWPAYLRLVEPYGTEEERKTAIKETIAWLEQHSDDNFVRATYLGLVERKGTPERVEQVMKETSKWLEQHPEDNFVRRTYLGLVERKETPEQVEQVVKETSKWLEQHPEDNSVRATYLGLVERKGTPEQVEQVVKETNKLLEQHPEDNSVHATYLGLVERKGTPEQVEQVVKETSKWLAKHYGAKEVWSALIALLVRSGRSEDAAKIALEAIAHHPKDPNLADHYLRFFKESGDEKIVRQLYETLVATYPESLNVPEHFAAWMRDHNLKDEARSLYKSLIDKAPKSVRSRYGYGSLLLDLEEFDKAIEQFREALRIRKRHQMAHNGLAQSLRGLAARAEQEGRLSDSEQYFAEAEREFRQAIYWAEAQGKPTAIFHTHIGWFYIDRKHWGDALGAFEQAIYEDSDFFGNYWGKGRALMGMGQFQYATDILRTALEKAPEDFQPPASEEIPELLKQCQTAIGN